MKCKRFSSGRKRFTLARDARHTENRANKNTECWWRNGIRCAYCCCTNRERERERASCIACETSLCNGMASMAVAGTLHHHHSWMSLSLQPSEALARTIRSRIAIAATLNFALLNGPIARYANFPLLPLAMPFFCFDGGKSAHNDSCAIDPNNKP